MPLDRDQYVRLRALRWLSLRRRGDVYLGPDHLLQVVRSFPYEHYRRIGYADLQSLTCRRTSTGLAVNILLGGITALLARSWLTYADDSLILAIVVAITALVWLAYLLQGGTCVCTVRSPIQTMELYSLTTMRSARRALPRIRTAVEQTQGSLSAEEARERSVEAYETYRRFAAVSEDGRTFENGAIYSPGGHAVLLSFTLATAALGVISWLFPQTGAVHFVVLTTPVALFAGVLGGIGNRGGATPRSLKKPIFYAALYCAALFCIALVALLVDTGSRSSGIMSEDVGMVANLSGIVAVFGLSVAIPGLLEVVRYRGLREAR